VTGLKQELLALVPPGLSFKDPLLLLLLLVVPLAVLLKVLRERRGDGALVVPTVAFAAAVRPLARPAPPPPLRAHPPRLRGARRGARAPRLGLERTEFVDGRGRHLHRPRRLRIDGRRDFKPKNRFVVAKNSVRQFIEGRRTDRVGLLVFAAARGPSRR